jgi:threonine/homoserine/homoserine lactone efflux protein
MPGNRKITHHERETDHDAGKRAPTEREPPQPAPAAGPEVWLAARVFHAPQHPPDHIGLAGFSLARAPGLNRRQAVNERRGAPVDLLVLLRGVALGFSIAAPVGPIGVLCIRRTLAFGRVTGLVTGLGAATADALYGALAAFGLTALASVLVGARLWVHLIGGAFLLYLGIRTLLARPAEKPADARGTGLVGAYASTLALTLANPATILSFAAVFAGLGVGLAGGRGGYAAAALTTLGVFAGSALWWLLLSGGVSLLRARLTAGALRWVNRASGAILIAFALVALATTWG